MYIFKVTVIFRGEGTDVYFEIRMTQNRATSATTTIT